MKKKLTKAGNSLALIIPKAILEVLGWDGTTDLEIDLQNGCIVVSKIAPVDLLGGA